MDPSQKEFYEIAYLAGLGNAQNMFIDMFPEANLGPSSDVVSALAEQVDAQDAIRDALSEYRTLLQAVTGTSSGSDSGTGGVSEFALTQEEQQALTQ